jgi:hypothetical protein
MDGMSGMSGMNDSGVMLIMPMLPLLLLGAVAVVTLASRRGLLGARLREVDISAPLVTVAAGLSVGAAGIHFAVVQPHLEEDALAAFLFLALGWFQVIWAMGYIVRPSDALRIVAVVVNSGVVVAWFISRTIGLPIGSDPWVPETVGMADLISSSFEIVLVGVLAAALVPRLARYVRGYCVTIEKAYVLGSFSVMTIALLTGLALLGGPVG